MPSLVLPSFAKGEIAPALYARVDTAMYKVALKLARNAIVHSYGGISNRPGTTCLGPVKDHSNLPRLFRFHLGSTDQYILEFGNLYMRVFRNDAIVLDVAGAITITGVTQASPGVFTAATHGYTGGEEAVIRMSSGMVEMHNRRVDIVYIDANTFSLTDQVTGTAIDTTNFTAWASGGTSTVQGIYEVVTEYAQADLANLKMVQSGNTLTVTHKTYEVTDFTRTGHNVWTLTKPTFAPNIDAPSTGLSGVSNPDSDFPNADTETKVYVVTSIADTDAYFEESVASSNITVTGSREAGWDNTITWDAVITTPLPTRYAVYRKDNGLLGLVGETEELTFTDDNIAADLTISPPKARNPFDAVNSYPQTSGYYEQRQVFGYTIDDPDTNWFSQTGLRLNMSVSNPLQANDAITASLSSQDVQEIRHYVALEDLIVFTNSGEWRIDSGGDSAFSTDTIKMKPQSTWGASHRRPLVFGKTILFAEDGDARIRSLGYTLEADGYNGNDITILASHLFANESPNKYVIVDMARTTSPESMIYVVRSDGQLCVLTFNEEQKVTAWTTWDTCGKFKSVATLRRSLSDVEDGVYFVVERPTPEGGTAGFVEVLNTRKFADVRDGYFLDGGSKYDIPILATGVTAASPGVITLPSGHGLADGDTVQISDVVYDTCTVGIDAIGNPNVPLFKNGSVLDNLEGAIETVANVTATTMEMLDYTDAGDDTNWNLGSLSFTSLSYDINSNSPLGTRMKWNRDGTKCFMFEASFTGLPYCSIQEYAASVAYDPTSLTYTAEATFNVDFFTSNKPPGGFCFNVAGDTLYIAGWISSGHPDGLTSGMLVEYSLSTGYDISSTITKVSQAEQLPGLTKYGHGGIHLMENDRTFVWNSNDSSSSGPTLTQASLAIAGDNVGDLDADTGDYLHNFIDITTIDLTPTIVRDEPTDQYVSRDGKQLFVVSLDGFINQTYVAQFLLTTAYDITTRDSGTEYQLPTFSGQDTTKGHGIWFEETNGAQMFVAHGGTQRISTWAMTPIIVSTQVGKEVESVAATLTLRKCVTNVTGLACQNGRAVRILADGNVEPDQTVTNGKITIADTRCAARIFVGSQYITDIETLNIEAGATARGATMQGKHVKLPSVMMRLHKSRRPLYGNDSTDLTPMRPRSDERYNEASGLLTGDHHVMMPPHWNSHGRMFIRMMDPLPLTILGFFPEFVTEDEQE